MYNSGMELGRSRGTSGESLTQRVSAVIESYAMIPKDSLILAAVSGGADSVALLRLLMVLRESFRFKLECVHVEHGIRGNDSLSDARFVSSLCGTYGITCHTVHVDAPAAAKRYGTGLEDAARRIRYETFENVMIQTGAERVVLAHHKKDQAETVLLHMTRGSGLTGLSGMRRVRGPYIRPLLDETPETLREYLRSIGQDWCEDATNSNPDQPRVIIRTRVIPTLEIVNPRITDALSRLSDIIYRDNELLNEWVDSWLDSALHHTPYGGFLVFVDTPSTGEAFMARVALRLTVRLHISGMDSSQIAEWTESVSSGSYHKMNLREGWRVEVYYPRAHFISPDCMSDSYRPSVRYVQSNPPIEIVESSHDFGDGIKTQVMPRKLFDQCTWRVRMPGDRIQPFGMSGSKLLSDLFTDKKIDRPFREYVPLATIGSEVLWAVGVGASDLLRIEPQNNQPTVLIRWMQPLIWE